MSKQEQAGADSGRRDFLKTLGVAGGAVAVAAVSGEASAEVNEAADAAPSARGYNKTEHVRAYYATCRN